MNNSKFEADLKKRLEGKVVKLVRAVDIGGLEAPVCLIETIDGNIFRIHNSLGPWIEDLKSSNGKFNSLEGVIVAIEQNRERSDFGWEWEEKNPISVIREGNELIFDDRTGGELYVLDIINIHDHFERTIVEHDRVLEFIGPVVEEGSLLWKGWFSLEALEYSKRHFPKEYEKKKMVPHELMKPTIKDIP